ncbi:tRNA dihydrouridine synthase [Legionella waltersii]|uniref:tRNA-dihydrouridine synthase n=1 Tax=Legionella waltersii TaxID=66969 RepID=A0A0W1A4S4_9GAMM|nr:tRNA-dihydrouridine synthase family protein [Legionella waltersii]KTD76364.1 nitrogen regulation protein [Legionella waltersii]SNV13966.1 nitrogen regulation protein [Legionella waltersii]
MHNFINSPLQIGSLTLPNRLIQGPLAGYSCAPFRELFYEFSPPAYCVSEMCSANDVLHRHTLNSRYLYRSSKEQNLAYQISGNDPLMLSEAALKLESLGANLIDINCGCPKAKIRKKGAGSALLDNIQQLALIVSKVRSAIHIPLTVKIRIQNNEHDFIIAKQIEEAGADALIVHGRRWIDDYAIACDLQQIAAIKSSIQIPVIANGDIKDIASLNKAIHTSHCDAFMISRAGTGKAWIYKELLQQQSLLITEVQRTQLFIKHLDGLAQLENEHKAVLQSRSLIRYYFRHLLSEQQLQNAYQLSSLQEINRFLEGL